MQPEPDTLINTIAESLDSLEQEILAFEQILERQQNTTQHVHRIFRVAHNLKSTLGLAGREASSQLLHSIETNFDRIRRGESEASSQLLHSALLAIDTIRLSLLHPSEHQADLQRLQKEFENIAQHIYKQRSAVLDNCTESDGDSVNNLRYYELNDLQQTLLETMLAEGVYCYHIEKLVSPQTLSREDFDNLPVYDDIREIGLHITTYPCFDELPEEDTIIRILLASILPAEEIRRHLFDIVHEVNPSDFIAHIGTKALTADTPTQEVLSDDISEAIAGKMPTDNNNGEPLATQHYERNDIRIETHKLDALFELVGELVTIQNLTLHSPDLHGLRLPQFRKSATMLAKIIRQVQTVTMSLRMVPVETVFSKMRRVVRDVALKVHRRVELLTVGEETEIDKQVVDMLLDPLIHIVRNAVDHGIEPEEERTQNGKHPVGKLTLEALYEGNDILIRISDDGRGLSREKILRRATELGLVHSDSSALSNEELWEFIFEPGFSTAAQITDISGRGVGMDVVKKNIEHLHGTIRVQSFQGKGTTITLQIPLTLTTMDVMLMRVGTARYAVPLHVTRQSFRPQEQDVTVTPDGLEIVSLRSTLYPVIRLHDAFASLPRVEERIEQRMGERPEPIINHDYSAQLERKELSDGIVVMVESQARTVCLYADEVLGQQQTVIKPLSSHFDKARGLSGCMILSDGSIGLIVDVEDLIRLSEVR